MFNMFAAAALVLTPTSGNIMDDATVDDWAEFIPACQKIKDRAFAGENSEALYYEFRYRLSDIGFTKKEQDTIVAICLAYMTGFGDGSDRQ